MDFDGDGEEELLVIYLNNKEEQDGGPYQNGIYLRMYESEK